MGRSIFCSICKQEKGPGCENGSRCRKCSSEVRKRQRAERRLARGWAPIGSGRRSPNCYDCGKLKENPKVGYCHECKRKHDNRWRLETGRTQRHRTGKCRCGNEFASFSVYQCIDCYRKKRIDNRNDPAYEDKVLKEKVRSLTRSYIKLGKLVKENCKICGTGENVEAHHEDYTKPLDVKWLCRTHHRELHEINK